MNKITIKFNGKDIRFHFGLGFMGELLESLDMSIDEVMKSLDKNPFKVIPVIMFTAHEYACIREDKEPEYSKFGLIDLIDEDGGIVSEKTSEFLAAFTKSLVKDVPKEEVNPEKRGVKKSVSKKK